MRYAGVDEVGIGALAGSILAVAIAVDCEMPFREFRTWWPVVGVKDSKKTTPAQRAEIRPRLMHYLLSHGASISIGESSAGYINTVGFSVALLRAQQDAVAGAELDAPVDLLIVDGNIAIKGLHISQHARAKADRDYWIVAAASILAKMWRDVQMVVLSREFPAYHFEENMGYTGGSKFNSSHIAALRRHGLTRHHRKKACLTALAD